MADPAIAANEKMMATSSPGLPRYFLQMSENSKISPCFAREIQKIKLVNNLHVVVKCKVLIGVSIKFKGDSWFAFTILVTDCLKES